ncbi:hypothetical protein Stsp02_18840 [Streptomyces sp. NBRC 14336]|uniref:DUF402 domain-containing protein n=1 Tax=Streptomyces sp. NBRC 14336 TaxID=3030992 RepID=UPI0024A25AB3|nr:DUF402 domain-containing protein [Streptomyces sp. NBRC 14336]GLW46222.1 hypothetical protein Stsp02_18840 [Streptomyces sp. NBRC 14336]
MSVNSTDREGQVDVVLVKAGRTKMRYPATLLQDDGTRITVRADFAGDRPRDFGFVRFEPGDVFTEYYWRDRWYAIKAVHTSRGALKGWYCDIARPATFRGTELVVEDLDLDLWRSADATDIRRLDEDEFEESDLATSDPQAAAAAVAALDELEALAAGDGFEALLAWVRSAADGTSRSCCPRS